MMTDTSKLPISRVGELNDKLSEINNHLNLLSNKITALENNLSPDDEKIKILSKGRIGTLFKKIESN